MAKPTFRSLNVNSYTYSYLYINIIALPIITLIPTTHRNPLPTLPASPLKGATVGLPPPPPIPLRISPPSSSVLLPTTTSVGVTASEIRVPETVTTPPGTKVCPPIAKSEAVLTVYIWPPKVKASGAAVASGILDVPSRKYVAETGRERGVPETVMTPPGARVCEPKMNAEAELAVYVPPAKVIAAGPGAGVAMGIEYAVPEIVTTLPGTSVCDLTTKAEAELAVMVWVPKTMTGVLMGLGGVRIWVWPPTMAMAPEEGRETGVEAMVMMPPGVRTWVPRMKLEEGSAVRDWPATVMIMGLEGAGTWFVEGSTGGALGAMMDG